VLLEWFRICVEASVTSKDHEYLGSVGKAEVGQGEASKKIPGDVVDEDAKQRHATEEIDAQISGAENARAHGCLGTRLP
jgi:hypothetical protein